MAAIGTRLINFNAISSLNVSGPDVDTRCYLSTSSLAFIVRESDKRKRRNLLNNALLNQMLISETYQNYCQIKKQSCIVKLQNKHARNNDPRMGFRVHDGPLTLRNTADY